MEDISLPMRPFPKFIDSDYSVAEIMYIDILEQEIENEFTSIRDDLNEINDLPNNDLQIDDSETDTKDAFITEIKPTHYEAMKPDEVFNLCSIWTNNKNKIWENLLTSIQNFLMEYYVLTLLQFLLKLIPPNHPRLFVHILFPSLNFNFSKMNY